MKWKLLIPFLFFSFVGTTALVTIGLSSQEELIRREEKKQCHKTYHIFLTEIEHKKEQALSLASVISKLPEVGETLARKDRETLKKITLQLYEGLNKEFGVSQFHFHVAPGKSFLRLHRPEEFGELMSYRKAPMEVMASGKGVAGIEWGLSGLGVRGVAPVLHESTLVGTLEIGFPLDGKFLATLKRNWEADFTVYEKRAHGDHKLLASTRERGKDFSPEEFLKEEKHDASPTVLISPKGFFDSSILLGPVKDYQGETVALVEIGMSRWAVLQLLSQKRNLMVLVGLLGLFLSFALTWLVATLFIRPIRDIVKEAREIAQGKRESRLHPRPNDEIGVLTQSLNLMLTALKERQRQVQDHAKILEVKVRERTADLVASEEKYRTLVENLPLVVYRILPDGTTEFVNPYFSEKLGYPAEEVGRERNFWLRKICGHEGLEEDDALRVCWEKGIPYQAERLVRDKQGRLHAFIDHALPFMDGEGGVKWIDGTMVEITELKRLQEKAIRTEEIKTLGEISARFAHELRNPLMTVGGFARRLYESLPGEDPNRKAAGIIVEEVARLESILRVILTSIEPFKLSVKEVDLNRLLRSLEEDLQGLMEGKGIHVTEGFSPDVPIIRGDEGLLRKAFENLLKNALIGMPEGEGLRLATSREDDHVVATIGYRSESMSDEDLEQFFFPRFNGVAGGVLPELPLSKVIIHRHGGKVDVLRKERKMLLLRVELPVEGEPKGGS